MNRKQRKEIMKLFSLCALGLFLFFFLMFAKQIATVLGMTVMVVLMLYAALKIK